MNKIIASFMLIAVVFAGSITTDAKKTSKKSSAKSTSAAVTIKPTGSSQEPLDINMFCSPEYDEQFGNTMVFNNINDEVIPMLSRLGFTTVKTGKTVREEICGNYERNKVNYYVCTRKDGAETITIKLDTTFDGSPVIQFPSADARDRFLETARKAGFTNQGGGFYQGPSDCYYMGTDLQVEGNNVKFIIRMEC